MAPRWTPDHDAALRRWYAEYVPLAEIGRRLARAPGAVHARRIALRIPARRRPWPWPPGRDAELLAAAEAGEPAAAVARRLRLPLHAVCRHRRHHGLGRASRHSWTPGEDVLVRDTAGDPGALAALAVRLRRSDSAVAARARSLATDVTRSSGAAQWTEREDELLRHGYGTCMTCATIAAELLPGRSPRAISARAYRLGLTTYGRRWTPAEDAALRALVARGGEPAAIARTLTRTAPAVRRRATRLGLTVRAARRPREPWTDAQDALLRQWRTIEPGRLALLLGRGDGSVRARLRALGLSPDGSPHYQPPATDALMPAQRRLVIRYSRPMTRRRLMTLAERLGRDPAEVLRIVAEQRRLRAA